MRRAPVTQAAVKFGEADLTTCDREPIHIPGSIQPHGMLLVMDRQTLHIEQVAGDAGVLLGIEELQLAGMPLSAALDADAENFVAGQLAAPTENVAPAMRLNVRSRKGTKPLDLTVHAMGQTAIVELEPVRSEPFGYFNSATDPIARLKHLLSAVQMTASVEECCAAAAVSLRKATGFDRAMVYRFLPDDSGEVVAEDAREGLESFLGLHYPASDIPQQARELYRRNWIRTIPDINYAAAPLIPAINPRTGTTVDMSHCALRSVSPIHVEYLRNMGVCASMSASIVCREKLWGMLVLHHYSPHHVAADLRVACETFAQIFSLHVDAKAQAETSVQRLDAQRSREELVGTLAGAKDIGEVISAWDLMSYVGATGAVVHLERQDASGGRHAAGRRSGRAHRLAQRDEPAAVCDRPAFRGLSHEPADFPPSQAAFSRWVSRASRAITCFGSGPRSAARCAGREIPPSRSRSTVTGSA